MCTYIGRQCMYVCMYVDSMTILCLCPTCVYVCGALSLVIRTVCVKLDSCAVCTSVLSRTVSSSAGGA